MEVYGKTGQVATVTRDAVRVRLPEIRLATDRDGASLSEGRRTTQSPLA